MDTQTEFVTPRKVMRNHALGVAATYAASLFLLFLDLQYEDMEFFVLAAAICGVAIYNSLKLPGRWTRYRVTDNDLWVKKLWKREKLYPLTHARVVEKSAGEGDPIWILDSPGGRHKIDLDVANANDLLALLADRVPFISHDAIVADSIAGDLSDGAVFDLPLTDRLIAWAAIIVPAGLATALLAFGAEPLVAAYVASGIILLIGIVFAAGVGSPIERVVLYKSGLHMRSWGRGRHVSFADVTGLDWIRDSFVVKSGKMNRKISARLRDFGVLTDKIIELSGITPGGVADSFPIVVKRNRASSCAVTGAGTLFIIMIVAGLLSSGFGLWSTVFAVCVLVLFAVVAVCYIFMWPRQIEFLPDRIRTTAFRKTSEYPVTSLFNIQLHQKRESGTPQFSIEIQTESGEIELDSFNYTVPMVGLHRTLCRLYGIDGQRAIDQAGADADTALSEVDA